MQWHSIKHPSFIGPKIATWLLLTAIVAWGICSSAPGHAEGDESTSPARLIFVQTGVASWYGNHHQGRRTASGERFNMYALTAAHRSLPFGTILRVTNLKTGKAVVVRINDRGPYIGGRILDLSAAAGKALDLSKAGLARVRIEALALNREPNRLDTASADRRRPSSEPGSGMTLLAARPAP